MSGVNPHPSRTKAVCSRLIPTKAVWPRLIPKRAVWPRLSPKESRGGPA